MSKAKVKAKAKEKTNHVNCEPAAQFLVGGHKMPRNPKVQNQETNCWKI